MQYTYIRVSSADQNTARQEEALSKSGFQPDKICVEHASAKDTNRPGLQELLEQLRPGDTLLVHSIDRLCRNMSDMCAVTTRLRDQGITLIFLKEQLTFSAGTKNPMQELQLHMMSAFSQFERALLKERQADGIAAKKAWGEKTGHPSADIKIRPVSKFLMGLAKKYAYILLHSMKAEYSIENNTLFFMQIFLPYKAEVNKNLCFIMCTDH